MNLEDQVTSLELSKRLKELGVAQESFFYWTIYNNPEKHFLCYLGEEGIDRDDDSISALTASELFELLPKEIIRSIHGCLEFLNIVISIGNNKITLCNKSVDEVCFNDTNICNFMAKMLIHLIENDLLEIK